MDLGKIWVDPKTLTAKASTCLACDPPHAGHGALSSPVASAIDGMWTEALAVLIIALANVICYITHEKSLLHGHLRLPKILFISNR